MTTAILANTQLKHVADGEADVAPPAKKLRKGTKSCAECRRRKIKCNYDMKLDICDHCSEKSLECLEQAHRQVSPKAQAQPKEQQLQGRLNQLEGLVKTLLVRLDDKDALPAQKIAQVQDVPIAATDAPKTDQLPATPASLPDTTIQASKPKQGTKLAGAKPDLGPNPYLGLFQNDFVEPQGDWVEPVTTAIAQDVPGGELSSDPTRTQRLSKHLLALFPPQEAIRFLAREFGHWYSDWTQNLPEVFDSSHSALEQFIRDSMTCGSPVLLGQSLLALAMCLQQVRPGYDVSHLLLAASPYDLADKFGREVYRLVLADDDLAGTFEGIQCLIVYGKFCMVAGRPRRAWLAHRRAVTFAQLLNLHRQANRAVDSQGFSARRKEQTWANLYILDSVLALVFGQPYTICTSHCDIDITKGNNFGFETTFMVRLAGICNRIIDRNHDMMHSTSNKLLSTTFEIDQELEEVVQSSPGLFAPTEVPGSNSNFLLRFLYHHIRLLLHLPLMIKSASDTRFHHGKVAAVDAAREMVRCYQHLRTNRAAFYSYNKVLDFEAFTAAMLLILNVVGYSKDLTQGHESDWNLVQIIIDLLRSSINETGGKVSEQCLRTLEMFFQCKEETCDGTEGQTAKVVVPFYGTLVLGPNRTSAAAVAATAARHADAESKANGPNQLPTPSMTDSAATSPNVMTPAVVPTDTTVNATSAFSFDLNQGMFPYSTMGQGQFMADVGDGSWNMFGGYSADLDHDWNWNFGGGAPT